ncbi:MAG: PAS domain S-box protein [Candidatus Thiodiazotropha sp. (ex Dulcina madagascariensis)]|nr:PAS domain S-box protein [Candidatus Thiodiazotropha sp. (ex Dulcina madagascariensis)]
MSQRPPLSIFSVLLLASVITALTFAAIYYTLQQKKAAEIGRLQAIADLKAEQLNNWLQERRNDARSLQLSQTIPSAYRRWLESNDGVIREELISHLQAIVNLGQFEGIRLLDGQGQLIWHSGHLPDNIDSALRTSYLSKTNRKEISLIDLFQDSEGHIHLDYVVPFHYPEGSIGPILILHTTPSNSILPSVSEWPIPSLSGEVVLFRRDGEDVLFLNPLKHAPDASMKLRWPVMDKALLAAQLARGKLGVSHVVEGKDYRHEPVFGVGRNISGTDWFLLAKLDSSEVYADAVYDFIWISLTGTLALLMGISGLYLLHQRQQLALARGIHEAQTERLQALQLLSAIAGSSTDAIYAKDREGHYLLFNKQAEIFTGKTMEEVLGRDDTLLFPADQAEMLMASDRMLITSNRVMTSRQVLETPQGGITFLTTKGPLRNEAGEVIGVFGISRDITALHKVEMDLREKESRLRALFETIPDLIWMKDPAGVYLACNPAFERFFGAEEPQILGKTDYDFVDKELADFFRANDQAAIEAGAPRSNEEWITFADDGHRALMLTTKAPIHDGDTTIGVLGIARDITQQRQVEKALLESVERFRLFYEQAPIAYESHDINGEILDINPAWLELLGFRRDQRDQVIGRPFTDFVVPEQRTLTHKRFEDFLAHGKSQGDEYDLQRQDGQIITVSRDGRAGHDAQGAFQQTHCVLHNITERRRHEQALTASESRYRELVDKMSDGVAVYEAVEDGRDFLFREYNRAGERIGRNSRQQVIGRRVTEAFPGIKELGLLDVLQRVWKSGKAERYPSHVYQDKRLILWVENYVYKLPSGEIVAVFNDITERKIAEIEVRRLNVELEKRVVERTAELEAANRELESFVYSVSHDLRAPLRGVTGFAQILTQRHRENLNEEGRHYLDNVVEASSYMGTLIEDLLQYSRTGRGSLQLRPVELGPILQGLKATLAERIEASGAKIAIDQPLATPLGDTTLIGQILSNLIDNALTYCKPGQSPKIGVASQRQENRVVITVSDDGIGIATEYHKKIFQVFQRLHNPDEYPGTGIGLAIVAKAARMMDGEVVVESALARGSRFSVVLPAAEIH